MPISSDEMALLIERFTSRHKLPLRDVQELCIDAVLLAKRLEHQPMSPEEVLRKTSAFLDSVSSGMAAVGRIVESCERGEGR